MTKSIQSYDIFIIIGKFPLKRFNTQSPVYHIPRTEMNYFVNLCYGLFKEREHVLRNAYNLIWLDRDSALLVVV